MNKKITVSSVIIVLMLTIVSFSNVVGYQSVKTSQEELIGSEYSFNEFKDYLFETLVEISNNEDIKEIIKDNYKPQRTILPFRRNKVPLKVEHLELLYEIGSKIMDRLGEDEFEELMENIEIPEYADELDTIILGNDELRDRIYRLNEMNNKYEYTTSFEDFPIICVILTITFIIPFNLFFLFSLPMLAGLPHFYPIFSALYITFILVPLFIPTAILGIPLALFCLDIPN